LLKFSTATANAPIIDTGIYFPQGLLFIPYLSYDPFRQKIYGLGLSYIPTTQGVLITIDPKIPQLVVTPLFEDNLQGTPFTITYNPKSGLMYFEWLHVTSTLYVLDVTTMKYNNKIALNKELLMDLEVEY